MPQEIIISENLKRRWNLGLDAIYWVGGSLVREPRDENVVRNIKGHVKCSMSLCDTS